MTTVEFDCSESLQEGKDFDYIHAKIYHGGNLCLKGMYFGDNKLPTDTDPFIELNKDDAIHLAKTILTAYSL